MWFLCNLGNSCRWNLCHRCWCLLPHTCFLWMTICPLSVCILCKHGFCSEIQKIREKFVLLIICWSLARCFTHFGCAVKNSFWRHLCHVMVWFVQIKNVAWFCLNCSGCHVCTAAIYVLCPLPEWTKKEQYHSFVQCSQWDRCRYIHMLVGWARNMCHCADRGLRHNPALETHKDKT